MREAGDDRVVVRVAARARSPGGGHRIAKRRPPTSIAWPAAGVQRASAAPRARAGSARWTGESQPAPPSTTSRGAYSRITAGAAPSWSASAWVRKSASSRLTRGLLEALRGSGRRAGRCRPARPSRRAGSASRRPGRRRGTTRRARPAAAARRARAAQRRPRRRPRARRRRAPRRAASSRAGVRRAPRRRRPRAARARRHGADARAPPAPSSAAQASDDHRRRERGARPTRAASRR